MKYQCLYCKGELKKKKDRLKCTFCSRSIPIKNKIPFFSKESIYWGEITKKDMDFLNSEIKKGKYWKDIFKKISKKYSDQFPEPFTFTTDLSRANWHHLIEKKKDSIALDIGAGTGTNSEILANHYDKVVSIEPVNERLIFCQKRFEQESLKNIELLKANALELPFADNSFDLIVLNGVLEWVATYSNENPRKVQIKVLKKIHRMLKPGGVIYVGIENRFCFKHFIGLRDPHVNLRFVTILPRALANLYSLIFSGTKYKTYIYSSKGYEKLFAKAGFKNLEIFNAIPDYNVPTYILPLKNNSVYSYVIDQFAANGGIAKKILAFFGKIASKIGLTKYILPAFIILGKK